MTADLDRLATTLADWYRIEAALARSLDVEALEVLAAVRRDKGRWRESVRLSEAVLEVDPTAEAPPLAGVRRGGRVLRTCDTMDPRFCFGLPRCS